MLLAHLFSRHEGSDYKHLHIMSSLENLYKLDQIVVSDRFSPYDILITEDQTVFFFFLIIFSGKSAVAVSYIQIQLHYWESAGVAALCIKAEKPPAASCSCSHFVQLGQVIMGFINQHRIERNLSDSLLKLLNVQIYFIYFLAGTSLIFTSAAASQTLV